VQAFLNGTKPDLTFVDGREVVRLLMAAYRAAELGREVDPLDPELADFQPAVARGCWKPNTK